MSLLRVIYLGEVPPLVGEFALGADVLTLRSHMARASSVARYLLSNTHLVCRTYARGACWVVQGHAGILLCHFHGNRSPDGLV